MRIYLGFSYILLSTLTFTAGFSIASPRSLSAEEGNNFFAKDAALTVFENDITKSDIPRIEILRPKKQKEELQQQEVLALQEAVSKDSGMQVSLSENLNTPEGIVAKFGDPTKDAPVFAQDNAPTPFKGMMAALEAGDDKLAFNYARQYARHLRNLDQRTKRAMAFQALAMEKEGMLPADGWQSSKNLDAERFAVEEEMEAEIERHLKTENTRIDQLDPKARAFLQKAAQLEGIIEVDVDEPVKKAVKQESVVKEESQEEQRLRAEARAHIATKASVDPKGEVDIYFFLRSNDRQSIVMGEEFQKLFQKWQGSSNVTIVALTVDKEDTDSIAAFRLKTKAKYPIANGAMFSKQLGIKSAPSVISIAKNTGQAVMEEGVRNFYYLDELLTFMTGVGR